MIEEDHTLAPVVLERRWLPGDGGSLVQLSYSNVSMLADSPPPDWGRHTPGAYALALAIIEAALARSGHAGPRMSLGDQRVYLASALLHRQYVNDVLATVGDEAIIPTRLVDEWVDGALRELDPALVAARFSLAGEEGGPWTADEVAAIVGAPVYETGQELIRADGRVIAARVSPHPLDMDEPGGLPL